MSRSLGQQFTPPNHVIPSDISRGTGEAKGVGDQTSTWGRGSFWRVPLCQIPQGVRRAFPIGTAENSARDGVGGVVAFTGTCVHVSGTFKDRPRVATTISAVKGGMTLLVVRASG